MYVGVHLGNRTDLRMEKKKSLLWYFPRHLLDLGSSERTLLQEEKRTDDSFFIFGKVN